MWDEGLQLNNKMLICQKNYLCCLKTFALLVVLGFVVLCCAL
jgi:hypothetical protein